jgi:group I intron endonuclease
LLKQKKIRTNKIVAIFFPQSPLPPLGGRGVRGKKQAGKRYIGSSGDLGQRLANYFSSKYLQGIINRSKSPISQALLNYGYSNFKLEILEYCARDKVIVREQYYLDHSEHEYNILKTAGSLLNYHQSEATRQKLREA